MKGRTILALLLAAPWFPCGSGTASAQTGIFFDEFGAGLKAPAMAQAFTAVADDSSAAYYNPAGLTQVKAIFSLTAGYVYADPQLRAQYPTAPSLNLSGQTISHGLCLGIASSLDFERTIRALPWFRRFALGLILFANLPEFGQYHAGPTAIRPHFLRHDDGFQTLAIAISMAFEVAPWLSVGVGFLPSIDSSADEDVFQALNKMGPGDPVKGLRLSIHQTANAFVVPVCGLLLRPPAARLRDAAALGVSFRGTNQANHGKGEIRQYIGLEDASGNPWPVAVHYPDHYNINLVSYVPWQLTGALAVRPVPGLTLSYDMTFKRYSEYLTYLELAPEPPFRDTFTHRFGLQVAFDPGSRARFLKAVREIGFRAGYGFEPTPVQGYAPALATPNNNIYDADQDILAAGLSVTVADKKGGRHRIEFSGQFHRFRDAWRFAYIDAVYAFMSGLDETGTLPVEIGGHAWAAGAGYTLEF